MRLIQIEFERISIQVYKFNENNSIFLITFNCIDKLTLFVGSILLFSLSKPNIVFFNSTSLYVTHRSICFSIIWWDIQRILFLHTRVTEMFPQIFLSITNPKKNVYHVCKQRKRFFYFVTHLCVFTSGLRMWKEKKKRKKITYISQFFYSHSYSQIKIHRNHICLPAAIR